MFMFSEESNNSIFNNYRNGSLVPIPDQVAQPRFLGRDLRHVQITDPHFDPSLPTIQYESPPIYLPPASPLPLQIRFVSHKIEKCNRLKRIIDFCLPIVQSRATREKTITIACAP
jgi:hypothetical protein